MPQSIRITITPDLEHALQILRQSTLGTLNTTELIKMAVGSLAQIKKLKEVEMTPQELNTISSQLFHDWAREDETIDVANIAHPEKLKPFSPKTHVRTG